MASRVHVFVGPTLSVAEVRKALPDALVHRPVGAGDLAALDVAPGDVVVLVDGPMASGRAVRHKEIVALVEAGAEVWGTGTLGALRAAELLGSGVRAHGRVARLLLRGVLGADDEVAVEPPGLALVDVRATCRAACRAGVLDTQGADHLVAAAQSLAPHRRSYEEILAHAVETGLDSEVAWAFEAFTRQHPVRLAHDDALACLRAVRRRRGAPPRGRGAAPLAPTVFAAAWREQAEGSEQSGAGFVPDLEILDLCRLLAVDYPDFQRRVALQALAAEAAPTTRSGEREGQAMLREFAAERGLDVDSLHLWMSDRGLRREELLQHLRRHHAVAMVLEAYGVHPDDEPAVDAVLAGVVAEHARRRGFVAPGTSPSWERSWLSAAEMESLAQEERIARLAARSFQAAPGVPWHAPVLQELKVSGVFRVAREAVVQARELEREHPDPGDDEVVAWFVERWEVRDRFDLALLDRGFPDTAAFLRAGRRVLALDRASTVYRELRCLGRRPAAASS